MIARSDFSPMPQDIEKSQLTLGIVRLTDCAPLVAAAEKGFFAEYGLKVRLSVESSWSAIRDKVAVGLLDGAQMLAGIPLAASLGVGGMQVPMVAPMSLDLNGNAITLSSELFESMRELSATGAGTRPMTAEALRVVLEDRVRSGRKPVTFATVYPVSSHHYELRYWLAAGGIDPDRDVRLVVVPPSEMVEALRRGGVDGFCVGEPWNSLAVHEGVGQVAVTSWELWNNKPEKVLGFTKAWADRHPRTLQAVLSALIQACRWLDEPLHRQEAIQWLADPAYVGVEESILNMSMTGVYHYSLDEEIELPDFNVFHRYAANYPWRSHAVWYLTQMIRWGQLDRAVDLMQVAERVYRPDLYRAAAESCEVACPTIDYKVEGLHARPWILRDATAPIPMGPDRFIDGKVFDPTSPIDYLRGFDIRCPQVSDEAIALVNP